MNSDIENIVICDAVRTPFCHAHQYRSYTPVSLLAKVIQALCERNRLSLEMINGVITGTVMHDSRWTNVARMASMKAGLPITAVDYSVQGNCNSGFMALFSAIGEIVSGSGTLYIASGVEQMSSYGFRVQDNCGLYPNGPAFLTALEEGDSILENTTIKDGIEETLTDTENNVLMIEVAEIMANYFAISREEQDQFTRESLIKAVDAVESGVLSDYLIPMGEISRDSYPINRKRLLRKEDSFLRAEPVYGMDSPEFSVEAFMKKNGAHLKRLGIRSIYPSVTMYNSTVPGDGAGGCIVTTEKRAKELGLKPRLRVINWQKAGVDPMLMGIGPVESTYKMFGNPQTERAQGVTFDQVDTIEIHEAFAAQVLSVFKQSADTYGMVWDREKVNRYGGSLAFTHPLGASNHRLITNILSLFDHHTSSQYALATGCAGGGLGVSLLFERYR